MTPQHHKDAASAAEDDDNHDYNDACWAELEVQLPYFFFVVFESIIVRLRPDPTMFQLRFLMLNKANSEDMQIFYSGKDHEADFVYRFCWYCALKWHC